MEGGERCAGRDCSHVGRCGGPRTAIRERRGATDGKLPINSAHQSAFLLLIGTAHHRLAGPISRLFQRPLCLAKKKAAEQMVQWVMVYPVRKKTVVAAAQSPATTHGTSTWRR